MTAVTTHCSADVCVGPSTWVHCRKAATHIEAARWYCGTHAPSRIAARAHARSLAGLAEAARHAAFQCEQQAAALAAHIEAWQTQAPIIRNMPAPFADILAWCRHRLGATTEVVE